MSQFKRSTTPRTHRRLTRIASAAALVLAFQGALAQTEPAAAPAAVSFNVPAQPLDQALAQFARQAGLQLAASPDLLRGRLGREVRGAYGMRDALDRLLQDTGVQGSVADGLLTIEIRRGVHPETALPAIRVRARHVATGRDEGSVADGYLAHTLSAAGVLGEIKVLDAPFAVSVVPHELLQNLQVQSPDDVYKLHPATRTMTPQASGWSPAVMLRGFATYDSAEDGLRRPYNHAAVVEDKERYEVLSGLSGFLYGAAAPSGMINSVSKRPTTERLANLTAGNYGGSQYYLHADFGGRLDATRQAGYRLNAIVQDGGTATDDQTLSRQLLSGAIDWQIADHLLLELNATYNHYRTKGATAYWFYDVPHGPAPDPHRLWSQPWIEDEFKNRKLMARATYSLGDRATVRVAYKRDWIDRPRQDHAMNYVGAVGEFEQIRIRSGRTKNVFDAGQALADVGFDTGPLAHKLTLGYTMYSDRSWGTTYNPNTGWQGPYPLGAPTYVAEPTFPADNSVPYDAGRVSNRNWVIGDMISFNENWSVLAGVNRSRIVTRSFDATGARNQPDYDRARNSPSLSVLFKPSNWLTTYLSYLEGLEQGGVAPETAGNAGQIQPPMASKQHELGIKADAGGVMWTAALFRIEKAYEFTGADNVYSQNGRQNHRGLEMSATGQPIDRTRLVAGATWLDASVRGGDFDGKEPMNVAKLVLKLYAEYDLAQVPGLSITAGLYHTGKQWANDANTDRLPTYTTTDLGLRLVTPLWGREAIWRLAVNNATDRRYWANSYYTGSPRSVAFSGQIQF